MQSMRRCVPGWPALARRQSPPWMLSRPLLSGVESLVFDSNLPFASSGSRRAQASKAKQGQDQRAEQENARLKAAARDEGAVPVGTMFATLGALGFGVWYSGALDSRNSAKGLWVRNYAKGDHLASWLTGRGVKVVVFEVDGVMMSKFKDDAVPRHELEDFLSKASSDFVEAARALSRHNFDLAVASRLDPEHCNARGRSPKTHVAGPELAKALLSRRCPEALPHFKIMVGYDPKVHASRPENAGKRPDMYKIAAYYGVTFREIALIDVAETTSDIQETWVSVVVQEPKEGFMFADVPQEGVMAGAIPWIGDSVQVPWQVNYVIELIQRVFPPDRPLN